MTPHLARSRVTKALTDAGISASFADAEARLDLVFPVVTIGQAAAATAAGQAAALTAIVTAKKCFGRVAITGTGIACAALQSPFLGATLGETARDFGADVATAIPARTTHLLRIGDETTWRGWQSRLWWDRWLAGTRAGSEAVGSASNPLSGIFAGALGVRQIFAHVRTGARAVDETVSLWNPSAAATLADTGPAQCVIPTRLWIVGLGHLGQAFVWALLFLPPGDDRHAVLQDDQFVGVENEPTSMLVGSDDKGRRKVRVAADWLERCGWTTELIERRHYGDIKRTSNDPAILISGLDDVRPRRVLAGLDFDYMIDAGIGHGARDFEGIQIRTVPRGTPTANLWLDQVREISARDRLMGRGAYAALEQAIGQCGVIPLADASVSVPFVGAATAALSLSQLARLGSMKSTAALLQIELGAPGMVIDGGSIAASASFLGGQSIALE